VLHVLMSCVTQLILYSSCLSELRKADATCKETKWRDFASRKRKKVVPVSAVMN
jgi:hypothetical protein